MRSGASLIVGQRFQNAYPAAFHQVLVGDVPIPSDHHLETGLFRRGQQRPVFQPVPPHVLGMPAIVARQQIGEFVREVLVQQHPQAGAGERRRRCFSFAS
jgi:hypothetical protein